MSPWYCDARDNRKCENQDMAKRPSSSKEKSANQGRKSDAEEEDVGEGLSEEETVEVHERRHLRAVVIHEIIRNEGEGELKRSASALWWSGLAAGLAIGFSFLAEAVLEHQLPKSDWSGLVANLGYPVGFLIVILSRQQLFTENTLTAVLPVIYRRESVWFWVLMRLWGIVLAANILGCIIFAGFLAYSGVVSPEVENALLGIADKMMGDPAGTMLVKGIVSGWLIASLVWMAPSAESSEFFVIVFITYLMAIAECTHVVAGSVDAAYLLFEGRAALSDVLTVFFFPTLIGNVLGGTILFAVLSYAQVRDEIEEPQEEDGPPQPEVPEPARAKKR